MLQLKLFAFESYSYLSILHFHCPHILNKQLNKFDDYKNVIIVDPVEDLITDKKNFVDYLHLSDNGNEVLANSIYNKLKDKF